MPQAPSPSAQALLSSTLRGAAYDRWLLGLFAPEEARPLLQALHLLDQEWAAIRQHIKTPMMGLIRLQWWRDAIAAITAGTKDAQYLRHPTLLAVGPWLAAGEITLPALEPLLAAHEMLYSAEDSDQAAHPQRYGEAMAGLLCPVLGLTSTAQEKAAALFLAAWRHRLLGIPANNADGLSCLKTLDKKKRRCGSALWLTRFLPSRWPGLLPARFMLVVWLSRG